MRVLRFLTSSELPCKCLVGVYEMYSGEVAALVDEPAATCQRHRRGQQMPISEVPNPRTFEPLNS
jgi:hypothetical protein